MAAVDGPPGARRHRVGPLLQLVVLAAVLAVVAVSVAHQWRGVSRRFDDLEPGWAVLAGASGFAATAVGALGWRAAQRAAGGRLPLRPAARVFYVGQLGKYLPGSVWPLLAQTSLGRRYGLPRAQVLLGGMLQLALSLLVMCVLGLVSLPLGGSLPPWELALVVTAIAAGAVVLWPPIFNRVLTLGLRLLRRPLGGRIDGRGAAATLGWSTVTAVGLAAQGGLLARGLGADLHSSVLAAGALLLSTAIGILVIPVPAGAGIREGAFVLLVHRHLGTDTATAIALLSRLFLTLADVLVAGLGFALGRGLPAGPVPGDAVAATTPADGVRA